MSETSDPVMASPNLCQFCANIDFKNIYDGRDVEHMPNATRLLLSSETCELCSLICSTVEQNAGYDCQSASSFWLNEPILIRKPTMYLDEDDPIPNDVAEVPMTDVEIAIPVQGGVDIARLGIRALSAGTQSEDDELRYQAIIAPGVDVQHSASPVAFRRMHDWMQKCLLNHPKCDRQHSSSSKVSLPTRLLHIGPKDDDPCQLVLTTGMDVEYVALSHCWGKHQLLRTVKGNLTDHFVGIPLEKLPKTFREAIIVTKRLGIQFIWIDSLCIVQDDSDDWRFEALRMGSVYSGAKLTIAATGATDSSEGLFMDRPPLAPPVMISHGKLKVELFQHPEEKHGGIDWSALDERAWITQEFLLSKRILHFTRAQLIWSCSTINETENGEQVYEFERESLRRMLSSTNDSDKNGVDQSFYDDWNQIAKRYCSRQLTYPSDKPIAIQGLADTLANSSSLSYKHGIWLEPSVDRINISQLFWYCKFSAIVVETASIEEVRAKEALRRPSCLQTLPTWSWTSTIGDIAFHSAARDASPIPKSITLQHDALVMRTHLMAVHPQRAPDIVVGPDSETLAFRFFSRAALSQGSMLLPSGLYYFGTFEEPVGWGSFILPPTSGGEVLCCAMSLNIPDNPEDSDGVNVLLLQPKSDAPGVFEMVGVGEIMTVEALLAQPQVDVRIE